MDEPSVIDAWTGAWGSFDIDSLGGRIVMGETPEAESLKTLMALREIGLILQQIDGNASGDEKVELPAWAVLAVFRSVMKRLR